VLLLLVSSKNSGPCYRVWNDSTTWSCDGASAADTWWRAGMITVNTVCWLCYHERLPVVRPSVASHVWMFLLVEDIG